MNTQEYRTYCEEFFGRAEVKASIASIEQMSFQEFMDWQGKFFQDCYDYCKIPVQEYITSVRGENWKFCDEDKFDLPEYREQLVNLKNVRQDVEHEFLFDLDIYKVQEEKLLTYRKEQIRLGSLEIEVDGKSYQALEIIDVLWSGWETDNHAWLVEDDGVKKLVVSNHGEMQFGGKEFLINRIEEYQKCIDDSRKLLDMLDK